MGMMGQMTKWEAMGLSWSLPPLQRWGCGMWYALFLWPPSEQFLPEREMIEKKCNKNGNNEVTLKILTRGRKIVRSET